MLERHFSCMGETDVTVAQLQHCFWTLLDSQAVLAPPPDAYASVGFVHQIQVRCEFCQETYQFSEDEIVGAEDISGKQ